MKTYLEELLEQGVTLEDAMRINKDYDEAMSFVVKQLAKAVDKDIMRMYQECPISPSNG